MIRRAFRDRLKGLEPAARILQNVNALPPASAQGMRDHCGTQTRIPAERLKIDDENPCEIHGAPVPALKNPISD